MRHRDVAERKALAVLRAQGERPRDMPRYFQRLLATRKPCSCWMCGNPRRHFGTKTRQERIADDDMAQQLSELRCEVGN